MARSPWVFGHEIMIALPGMHPQQLKDAPFFPGDDPAAFLANGLHNIRGLAFLQLGATRRLLYLVLVKASDQRSRLFNKKPRVDC